MSVVNVVIKDRQLVADAWSWLQSPGETLPHPGAGLILPWAGWLGSGAALAAKGYRVGVWLGLETALADLEAHWPALAALPLIAVHFPAFTDGRGYSLARDLRRLGYGGELRAVGQVLRDQLLFLEQCGFDAFALAPGQDPEAALAGFSAYSHRPGLRRRAAEPA